MWDKGKRSFGSGTPVTAGLPEMVTNIYMPVPTKTSSPEQTAESRRLLR